MREQNNQKVTWEDIVIRYAKEITRLTLENKRLMTERRKGMSEQVTLNSKCRLLFHIYLVEKAKSECPYCGLKLLSKEDYAR